MAATLLQAFKERYETIGTPGWPEMWSAFQPPGTAKAGFPNHTAIHRGDRSQGFQSSADRPVNVTLKYGRVHSTFYAVSLEEAEELAGILRTVMLSAPLEIGQDEGVWLFETDYLAGKSRMVVGPNGDFVFEAMTVYEAHFNPSEV